MPWSKVTRRAVVCVRTHLLPFRTVTHTATKEDPLALVRERAAENRNLAVLITMGDSPDPQVSLVNAAVIQHPTANRHVVAFVGRTGSKLRNLRQNARATLVFQAGWEWVAVRGDVELSGPDDLNAAINTATQRQLLRTIYTAAGGAHPDLEKYDQAMVDERRCAVLLRPERVWSNPSGSEHKEPGETK